MELKEIANTHPDKIRNDETLMRSYIDGYKSVFGYEPNCAGCTFKSDFKKFKNKVLNSSINLNTKTMATTKRNFKLKRQFLGEILWYRDGKKVVRRYGRHFDDEFVKEYLSKGKKSEIKERKAKFDRLPDEKAAKADETNDKSKDKAKEVEAEKVAEKQAETPKTEENDPKENKLPRKKKGRKPKKK